MPAFIRLCLVATIVALMGLLATCSDDGSGGREPDDGGDLGGGDVGSDPPVDIPGGDGADIAADLPLDGGFPTTLIGREGGTVVSSDGLLTLEIPPYAVLEEVEIAAVRLDDVDEERFHDGVAYGMVPHGLRFEVPATMRIEYTSAPPAGSAFGIGRNHEELIASWPIVRSEGNVVEVLIDGFDDGRPVEKQADPNENIYDTARDGLVICQSRDLCPRLDMLRDGNTVWIQAATNQVSLQFASSNSLRPPELSFFQGLPVTIEAGRRVHVLSGPAAIYWYRLNQSGNKYVSRIAYFGQAGPVAINNLKAVSPSPGAVRLSWEPVPFEAGGELVVERSTAGLRNRTEIARLGAGDNALTDLGLEPDTRYFYYVHHVVDETVGPRAVVAITPEGTCTITVSAYGEELTSGAPVVLRNSAVVLQLSDICLPSGTPRFEWVRYYEATGEGGGFPELRRELIRLGQAREATMTSDFRYWVEVCMQPAACEPDDVVAAADIQIYTSELAFATNVLVSPTNTPTAQQDFTVLVRTSDLNLVPLTEGGEVTLVELEFWTIEAPPTLPTMVHAVTLEAPDDQWAQFDIAGGTIPHNAFGYDMRIRVFDDAGVVSIPSPSGVFVQE